MQKQEVDNKSKKQEAQENNIQLIVPRSNTAKPFDPAEKTLDLFPSLVKLCIIPPGFLRVALGRNDRLQPAFFRKTTCRHSTIGLIHQQFAPGSQQLPQPLYQLTAFRTIMGIAGREMKNQRTIGTRGNQMNLGGSSSPGLLTWRRRSCCRRSKTLSKTPDLYHRLMRM